MEAFLPVLAFLPSARAEGPLRLLTGAFCGVHLLFVKIIFISTRGPVQPVGSGLRRRTYAAATSQ